MITLILGGEKSGKSDVALRLLSAASGPWLLAATGQAADPSFRRQIQAHRQSRSPEIRVAETGRDLPGVLLAAQGRYGAVLADSLDFWLFAVSGMDAGGACATPETETARLLEVLQTWTGGELILVSAEIGLGPIAASAGTRAFVRSLGALNRAVAEVADRVRLCVAGLPLTLKG